MWIKGLIFSILTLQSGGAKFICLSAGLRSAGYSQWVLSPLSWQLSSCLSPQIVFSLFSTILDQLELCPCSSSFSFSLLTCSFQPVDLPLSNTQIWAARAETLAGISIFMKGTSATHKQTHTHSYCWQLHTFTLHVTGERSLYTCTSHFQTLSDKCPNWDKHP